MTSRHPPIFDATFINADGNPVGDRLWPDALPGTTRSLMMGSILSPGGIPATSQRILEVADGCRNGTGFPNYGCGGAINYGPSHFGLVCLDLEIDAQGTSPAAMYDLIAPVHAAGYLVAVYYPPQPGGFTDDSSLKTKEYAPSATLLSAAKPWAANNKAWLGLTYANTFCGYFGAQTNDQTTLYLIQNMIRLSKKLMPHKLAIVTLCAQREVSWGGVGDMPDALCDSVAALIRAGGAVPQIWGLRSASGRLFKAFGVSG